LASTHLKDADVSVANASRFSLIKHLSQIEAPRVDNVRNKI